MAHCAQGGFIVVNGVLASAHSDWLLDDLVPASWQPALPAIYQALFRPLFWVYRLRGPAAFAGFRAPLTPAELLGTSVRVLLSPLPLALLLVAGLGCGAVRRGKAGQGGAGPLAGLLAGLATALGRQAAWAKAKAA